MTSLSYPVPADDSDRIDELRAYKILDTDPEDQFDDIVKLATVIFKTPIALISLVERDRQFFKAKIGLDVCETSREVSFCAHALSSTEVLVIPDAHADDRFSSNPLVTGQPFIRFYAGAPLVSRSGHKLGTLCIIDSVARASLSTDERVALQGLARLVMNLIEKRRLLAYKRAASRIAEATPDAVVCANHDGVITFWNSAAERVFGYTEKEALTLPLNTILPDGLRSNEVFYAALATSESERRCEEAVAVAKSGKVIPIELSVAKWGPPGNRNAGVIIRDVTERHLAQERARTLSHFDRLTELPNRASFLARITSMIELGKAFSVIKISLDRFRQVNATLGVAAGDTVLRLVAERLIHLLDNQGLIARLGGDEFGILCVGSEAATALAQAAIDVLAKPFVVFGSNIKLEASAGIVEFAAGEDARDVDDVLKSALLALQQAKATGGNRVHTFEPALAFRALARRTLDDELHRAARQSEFELFYQPQYRLADGKMVGAEALLRWRHPSRGLLTPDAFIAALETSPIAPLVGSWIIDNAAAYAGKLMHSGNPLRIGVNLFASQLLAGNIVSEISKALRVNDLPAEHFEIEITETTVLKLDRAVITPLERVRALGVGIAFDDYGTGYASLSLLKSYPLTRLKIDRDFVKDLERNPADAAIIKAMLSMARGLHLDVIAEGVETAWQASFLASHGCSEAQGYFFSKPITASALTEKISGTVAA